MQGQHIYEYAVIRFVPRVEREEFLNIGLILYSKRSRYLKVRYRLDEEKLRLFPTQLDMESLRSYLSSFDKICSGTDEGGEIVTMLDLTERFRWLTAVRSTSLQTSAARLGFSEDLDATFEALYGELVL
ncbi:DUF3037 domain-containing protein [uncultured Alistipes sp.]|jgi:hypothetical protein|uniref:DUF3037 domain-containing protein n=1 Tax=uncultured Alistipes sp. TaxID=538949 RepID=UPI0025DB0C2F|nr:DUF3037 domain-containing protein [uncultured Alistipes sp.]